MTLKCTICGREYSGGTLKDQQAMHCHLLRAHYEEYKAVNFNRQALSKESGKLYKKGSGAVSSRSVGKKSTENKIVVDNSPARPAGFRPLNNSNAQEALAYNEGFRYIDDDLNVYDRSEAREKGWI